MEYDPTTCITAGELRAVGIGVPSKIPDCAWVPRAAMRFDLGKVVESANSAVVATISLSFSEPFRWVKGTYTALAEKE